MKLHNYEKCDNLEVEKWIKESVKDISPCQLQGIKDQEIVRFAPFIFMKKKENTPTNIFFRFSIIFVLIIYAVLIIATPLNFIITGRWYYDNLKWFQIWMHKCGL